MAMYERQDVVNVEFLKSSHHMRRVVKLTHTGQLPPQLYGRLDPAMWQAFMGDMAQLAEKHPYTQAPNASQMGHWLLCGLVGAVIGFCAVPADAGDYGAWTSEVHAVLGKWVSPFREAGCSLSLQQTRLIWVQINIQPPQPGFATGYPVKA